MKALRFFGIALVAVTMCAGLAACSDDDDNSGSSSLKGTTWKIVKVRDFYEDEWTEYQNGSWFTFNDNGTVTSNFYDDEKDEDDYYEYFIKYTFDGTNLTLNFSNDDCTTGTFVIDGNTATYTLYWYDYDKDWSNEDEGRDVWILEKQ